jgi:hypothetical protein
MMGVDSMLPYTPPLLIVKVPPAISSILMLPSRAFLPSMLMVCVGVGGGGGDTQVHDVAALADDAGHSPTTRCRCCPHERYCPTC